jgi:hypothetical protein
LSPLLSNGWREYFQLTLHHSILHGQSPVRE